LISPSRWPPIQTQTNQENKMAKKRKMAARQLDHPEETEIDVIKREHETKGEKFKRLAEMRVQKATWSIQSVGKLANKYNYDYDDIDAQKILRHLQSELDEVRKKFTNNQKRKERFSLD